MHGEWHRGKSLFPAVSTVTGKNEVIHVTDQHFDIVRVFIQDTGCGVVG